MMREQDLFTRAKFNYEKKKQEVILFLAKSSSNVSQVMQRPCFVLLIFSVKDYNLFILFVSSVSSWRWINPEMIS